MEFRWIPLWIAQGKSGRQPVQFGVHSGERNSGFGARVHRHQARRAVNYGKRKINLAVFPFEPGGGYAQNGVGATVQFDRLADNPGIALHAAFPEGIAEYCDSGRSSRNGNVGIGKKAPQFRGHSQHCKGVGGNCHAA